MGRDDLSGLNGVQIEGKTWAKFHKKFNQVQEILEKNKFLIDEINQNHESKLPENLAKNVELIRELHGNIGRVVQLYSTLSSSCTKAVDVSSDVHSAAPQSGAHDGAGPA